MAEERKYPHKNKKKVKDNWIDGKHPKECTGKCLLFGCVYAECSTCRWSETHLN
jgi:hypothetical protein